jgi:hypothetical protein
MGFGGSGEEMAKKSEESLGLIERAKSNSSIGFNKKENLSLIFFHQEKSNFFQGAVFLHQSWAHR